MRLNSAQYARSFRVSTPFLALLLGTAPVLAAPPANDACSAAEVLTVNPIGACTGPVYNGTTVEATGAAVTESTCIQTANDVWYLVNTWTANVLYMNTVNGAASDLNVDLYIGNCNGLSLLQCGVRPDGQVDLTNLPYYNYQLLARVYHSGAPGPFGICFSGEASCTLGQYSEGCTNPTYGGQIDGFSVNGISFGGAGCQGTTSAVDFTAQEIRFTAEDIGSLQVSGNFPFVTYAGVWIDFDDDLDFGAGEFISYPDQPNAGNTINWQYAIPANTAGTHRMRVRTVVGIAPTADRACYKYSWGETHDYMAVIAPNPCPGTQINTNGCDAQVGHYIHELAVADLVQGGTFCENSNFLAADYSNLEVNVMPGNSYSYTVSTFDHQSIPAADHYVGWWMDLNDDGDFGDAGEFIGSDGPSTTYQNFGNISIPITAQAGTHRLRVRYVYQVPQSAGTSCTPYTNSETQDYTAVVTLPPGVCEIQYTNGCTALRMINSVTVADLNDSNTGCTGGNTIDDRTATVITLERGRNHSYTLSCGQFMGTAWWIDLNDDDDFSASESVARSGSISSSTHTGVLEIPADAPVGNHRLRVRAVSSNSPGTGDACTVYSQGETHDYTVNIVPAYCIDNLYGTNNCATNSFAIDDIAIADLDQTGTGCTGGFGIADFTATEVVFHRDRDYPFTIVHPNSASSANKYTGWWIDLNNDLDFDDPGEFIGSSTSPPSGNVTGTVHTPAGITPGLYRMRVRMANEVQSATTACTFSALGEAHDYTARIAEDPVYCMFDLYTTGCGSGDEIEDLSVADLVHTGSNCSPAGAAADHTDLIVNMEAGNSYPFTIGTNWAPDEYTGWWADFNGDGDFDDADEFIGSSGPSTGVTITGTVSIPPGAPNGNHRMRVRLVFNEPQSGLTACTEYTYGETHDYTLHIGPPELQLNVHAVLEGPYDPATGLMDDALRELVDFPLADPFPALGYVHTGTGNAGTVEPAVLAVTGSDAIVDWVLVELRDANTPATVVASRSALLQRDGDVVDVDGVSPLGFELPEDDHHVALRHRNHLGVMTAAPVALTVAPVSIDLSSVATHGTDARKNIAGAFPIDALWAGDVSFDRSVVYTGAGNDRDLILQAIGGTVATNIVAGYRMADVNLDGIVKYAGSGNDRDIILQNIGGSVATNTKEEQLP